MNSAQKKQFDRLVRKNFELDKEKCLAAYPGVVYVRRAELSLNGEESAKNFARKRILLNGTVENVY